MTSPGGGPLEGTRVVTVAVNLPGPVAAARLTGLGAQVTTVLPPGGDPLEHYQPDWYADLQPWIDWNYTQVALFENETDTAREWAMLAATTGIWIALPLVVGLLFLRRSEVK